MPTERFHLVDTRTGKYVRDAHGKPRLMAKATFDKQADEMREQGYHLGRQDKNGDHEDDGEEAGTDLSVAEAGTVIARRVQRRQS